MSSPPGPGEVYGGVDIGEMQIILVIFIVLIVAATARAWFSHRRNREMRWLAEELDLEYDPGGAPAMRPVHQSLGRAGRRGRSFTRNTLSGQYRGYRVFAADYHTSRRVFAIFQLSLPGKFPLLAISPERRKFTGGPRLEYDDISFESNEFSRKFRVKARDKKFAYDVCHPRMIDFLLANDDLLVQIERDKLTLFSSRCLAPKMVRTNLDRLVEFRELLPGYLFSGSHRWN